MVVRDSSCIIWMYLIQLVVFWVKILHNDVVGYLIHPEDGGSTTHKTTTQTSLPWKPHILHHSFVICCYWKINSLHIYKVSVNII